MNILRGMLPEQVEALRQPLFTAYRAVYQYQFERTDEAEAAMREAIGSVVPLLRPFRRLLPRHKQRYLRALDDASGGRMLLGPSDLLLLFDETIFLLHVRLSPRERGAAPPVEPWGQALRELLDGRRNWAPS